MEEKPISLKEAISTLENMLYDEPYLGYEECRAIRKAIKIMRSKRNDIRQKRLKKHQTI